ncbi:MAG: Clp protease ClpP [Evtepia sp.]
MRKYYSLVKNEREADLMIYGTMTSMPWLESDVSGFSITRELAELDADTINVYINSYGGETAVGLAIYNALKAHPAKIRTICDGFACSAASLVFMAGDERIMNAASLLMIHNAWISAEGDAKELRKQADDLETISVVASEAYRAAVNITDEQLAKLLDNETWIPPKDALSMGFATSIVHEQTDQINQSVQNAVFMNLTAKPLPEMKQTISTFLSALSQRGKETR